MSLLSPQLQAFLAVATVRTVHGAARSLGLTQTGVTQRIRALETQLSVTLFTRSRRGMLLTADGEALLRYCQAARDLEGPVLARFRGAGRTAEVRLVLTGPTSIVESRVAAQVRTVMRRFPELLVTIDVDDIENRLELLRSGAAQLAIVPREQVPREMDSKLLRPEKYLLVGARAWRGRALRDIVARERIIDFDPTDRMTRAYLKQLRLLGVARAERHFVNDNQALIALFAEGYGYGVLTEEVARPHLESGALAVLHEGSAFRNELALAWFPRPHMDSVFRALVDAIV